MDAELRVVGLEVGSEPVAQLLVGLVVGDHDVHGPARWVVRDGVRPDAVHGLDLRDVVPDVADDPFDVRVGLVQALRPAPVEAAAIAAASAVAPRSGGAEVTGGDPADRAVVDDLCAPRLDGARHSDLTALWNLSRVG